MSLIDEALKRARMEAAQRAAESEGLPYPAIPRHLERRRRRAWPLAVAIALAVIAGLGLGVFLASPGEPVADRVPARAIDSESASPAEVSPPPATGDELLAAEAGPASAAPDAPEPGPAAAAQTASPQRPEATGTAAPEPAPALASASPPAGSGAVGPESARATPGSAKAPTPKSRPSQPPATAPAEPAAAPSKGSRPEAVSLPGPDPAQAATSMVTDPDSGVMLVLPRHPAEESPSDLPTEDHLLQYALPDGGTIELGGIAWSENGPFALINGQVRGPGAVIEGYVLERIRPDLVVLSGDGRRIRLSLH